MRNKSTILNLYSCRKACLCAGVFLVAFNVALTQTTESGAETEKLPVEAEVTSSAPQASASEAPTVLEPLVITASGHEQEIKHAPASISVVTHDQLEALPYNEVTDALQEIPGVSVTTGTGRSNDISIRGMDPKYTLILVDGKRLNSRETRTGGGGTGNTDGVSEGGQLPPLETIERIEVIRGPMSSLYGSDAMGGVINVITKRIGDRWTGSVRTDGTAQLTSGYSNSLGSNFYTSGPLIADRLGLQISGSYSERAEDSRTGGSPERTDQSLSAKLAWKVSDDHNLLFEVSRYEQETTSTPGKSAELTDSLSERDQERMVYSVSHSANWGPMTSESYVQYEDATNNSVNGTNTLGEKQIENLTGQTSFIIPLDRHTFNVGAFYRNQKLTDPNNALGDSSAPSGKKATGADHSNWALFADDEWRIFNTFALTGGLRMDDDELYGAHWTPRIYGVYTPLSNLTVKAGLAYGFRAPDLRQTLEDWGQTSRGGNLYGNPNLDPETSRTYEIGFIYEFSSGIEFGLTAYQTDFEDKIMRVRCTGTGLWCETAGTNYTTYDNVDEAQIRGLEMTLDVPLTESLSVKFTGTLLDSEIDDARYNRHGSLNDLPEKQASLSLNWRPKAKPYNAYMRVIYRGKESMPATDIVTNSGSAASASPAPDYATIDIGGSWKLNKTLTLYGGIMNLLDKQISYDESSYTIDGARIWAGVKASF